ncbi:Scr1 family TA system antitoxin-like transcriptional regulator [Gandjariella thermophila]|uniref:Scr1 family TA system antitoxin-like transcriptional regulator n=1 Tax=Gandjariella thermophila TaxID=1931992 RepID=UPI0010F9A24F|nr:Scr1 family TA system antitoxin-like transcriptional regulator [Gandjariella thermophila]
MPLEAGAHPGLENGFTILTLPEPYGDKGYVEGIEGAIYLEEQEHVRRCTLRFGILTSTALGVSASLEVIKAVLHDYQ